ncbi:MAG: hypothetical protein KDA53_03450 [Hyphomonas sp.]|nr:hypothetical protein [Hyphomonas sp.]
MTLMVITPPAEAALSLAAAKDYLRIGHDGEDALVSKLIAAAEARLEATGGLALVTRTLKRGWTCWPRGILRTGARLTPGPAASLVSVEIVDAEEATTLETSRFRLVDGKLALRPFAALPVIPTGGRVDVTYTAGFGAAADVPADLAQALKRLVLEAYRRENGDTLPEEVTAAIDAHSGVHL